MFNLNRLAGSFGTGGIFLGVHALTAHGTGWDSLGTPAFCLAMSLACFVADVVRSTRRSGK